MLALELHLAIAYFSAWNKRYASRSIFFIYVTANIAELSPLPRIFPCLWDWGFFIGWRGDMNFDMRFDLASGCDVFTDTLAWMRCLMIIIISSAASRIPRCAPGWILGDDREVCLRRHMLRFEVFMSAHHHFTFDAMRLFHIDEFPRIDRMLD